MNAPASTPASQIPTTTTTLTTTTRTTAPTTRTASSITSALAADATTAQKSDPTTVLPFSASNESASIDSKSASVLSSSSSISINQQDPSSSPRVVFGAGTVTRLPNELGRLSLSSPLIVSSPSRIGLARHIQALIPNIDSRILDSALVNVPTHVVDDAVARITGRDCVISVGGTTAVGLAKSIASLKSIPHICIPTTYSGSEMAPMLGEMRRRTHRRRHGVSSRDKTSRSGSASASASASSNSRGCSRQDSKALPAVIIYDEDLTASAPRRFSAPTGLEALAASRTRRASNDEDAQWSYIHLPGV